MNKYTFIVMPWEYEKTAIAATEKEAHKQVWESLTSDLKNNCECLDCVDEEPA